MIHFGNRRRDHERWERARRDWLALPIEGRVATVVAPAGVLIFTNALNLVPQVHDLGIAEELTAAGTIMAILTLALVQFTFGRHAKERLAAQEKRTAAARAANSAELAVGAALTPRADSVLNRLIEVQRRDPAFSEPLLLAFSRGLLQHIAARPGASDELLPYATPAALRDIRARLASAAQILVGPCRVLEVEEAPVWSRLTLSQPFLVRESGGMRLVPMRWTLRRSSAARSPAPTDLLGFGCPACGTPVQVTHPDGMCTTCDTAITHGQLCWQVVEVAAAHQGTFLPMDQRFSGADHPSARMPTVEDRRLESELRAQSARHPELPVGALEARAGEVSVAWFAALGGARVDPEVLGEDLKAAAGFQRAVYQAGGLTLHTGPATVHQIEWSRAGLDGWNELADLRVLLTLPWCLTDASGAALDGDPKTPRTLAVYVRLAHPTTAATRPESWRPWQILDPREYHP